MSVITSLLQKKIRKEWDSRGTERGFALDIVGPISRGIGLWGICNAWRNANETINSVLFLTASGFRHIFLETMHTFFKHA
jgi:hypothetical protein